MKYIIGLGNPGIEYENTRHNAGRIVLEHLKDLYPSKKVTYIEQDTFMNHSGNAVKKFITSKKKALDLIVIYDDLDLPVGKIKISWNKSSGGHKGVESIIKQVKTLEFVRIRIGIDKGKDPQKHIMAKFKPSEMKTLKELSQKIAEALDVIVNESWEKAASLYSNLEL